MKVLIFGGGYLGLRAALRWQNDGHQVFVVTRSKANARQMEAMNLHPIVADITIPETLNRLPSAQTVLFSVGFDRKKYIDIRDVYVTGLSNVLNRLSDQTEHLVYISTTGVYGDSGGTWIDEMTDPQPVRPGGKASLEAEQRIKESGLAGNSSILRLAGIYGEGRIPALTAVESGDLSTVNPHGHINLIHVDDAARLVCQIVESRIRNETFLVSDGKPPLRREFYQYIANQLGIGTLDWDSNSKPKTTSRGGGDKKVSNRKLILQTDYVFQYPDYQAGLNAAFESLKRAQ